MLLPSDVARLVLGYLQEEGLSETSQAFIHESPNLKEYADHTTADGTIPACLFSAFGKSLTTILNEYVATKTKESFPAVPAAMTSLWKKLDFTLNQIKSLQNTPAISACQRTRSRAGVANMMRQRVLTMASPSAIICSSVSETSSIISPGLNSHSMLGHSTPVSYATLPGRPLPGGGGGGTQPQTQDVRLSIPRDSPAQILVSEHRQTTGPMSPGRRKWDTPRKRGGAVSGSSNLARCSTPASGVSAEPQLEEAVDENFPQLVIQSARDKILGDRSLQEKLAENINKILGSDPVPQISKASSSTVEADQSIDEILGLQGEIHMSDDAIHDILEQTESDPAFQALYDLFDYNKTRFPDGEPGDEDLGSNAEQSDIAGPSSIIKPLLSEEPGTAQRDAVAPDTPAPAPQRTRAGPERKARKAGGTLLKKKAPGRSGRASRIEGSSARLLVSAEEPRHAEPDGREKSPPLDDGAFGAPMDVDEPLNAPPPLPPPPPSESEAPPEPAAKCSAPGPSAGTSAASADPEATLASNQEGSKGPAAVCLLSAQAGPSQAVHLPHVSVPPSGAADAPAASSTGLTPVTAPPGSAAAASTSSATLTASSPSPSSSSSPAAGSQAAPAKASADPGIVSLKIIISESQEEEESPGGAAASARAASAVSKEQIPTIYISSPAKSPGGGGGGGGLDEAAQAVSGLQNSEVPASPLCAKAGALVASPLTATSQLQQNYIFQLPLDAAAAAAPAAIQGPTASYFLLTEPPAAEPQTRPMLLPKGAPLATSQFQLPTAGQPQGYAAGSALILPSPLKPVVLPVSVMGQNTLGKVQVVSNQLVAIPNAVPLQQSETLKPISPKVAIQWPAAAGPEQHPAGKLAKPENTGQQDTATALRHKRILCFDSTAAAGASVPPSTSASASVQKPEKGHARAVTQTKPAILGGNKPKRRVQTVKCTADSLSGKGFVKEPEKPLPPPPPPPPPQPQQQQQQKDPGRRSSRKQDHSVINKELAPSGSTGATEASKPETSKKSDSKRRSKSSSRKPSHDKGGDEGKAKDSPSSNSSDAAAKSGAKKDKEDGSRKEGTEKTLAKACEGRAEKKAPSQETPSVTANKENEMKGSLQEQQQLAPLSSPSRDAAQPAASPQSKAPKTPSKTSSLAKQAAVMLHDIQGLNAPSTPAKRPGPAGPDAPTPRAPGPDRIPEDARPSSAADSPRTPARQRKGKDGEGTPKHLIPPNTPDVPTCSPASEAGSENSINMAAHTLMILSRAAIARTGTPLKDSLRQEGADKTLSPTSKTPKKRKQASPTGSPPAKKERERKKLVDCFPHDLDVDKFLSSLHYDE